jgi:hypothetical protein
MSTNPRREFKNNAAFFFLQRRLFGQVKVSSILPAMGLNFNHAEHDPLSELYRIAVKCSADHSGRAVRHEVSFLGRTLGSWVRIPFKA